MDKELLFEFLKTKFLEAGFSEDEAKLQISRLDKRYATMTDDAIDADVRARGGASHFAEAIILRRNTVLLRDPEYKRFAESSGSRIPPLHEKEEEAAYIAHTKAQSRADNEEELIKWFSADAPTSETDALPTAKTAPAKPTAQRAPRTETPATAGAAQVTENSPKAANADMQADAVSPRETPVQAPVQKPVFVKEPLSAQPSTPMAKETEPANTTVKQPQKKDMGSTRVIDVSKARKPTNTPMFSAERVQDDRSGEKKNARKEKPTAAPKAVTPAQPKVHAKKIPSEKAAPKTKKPKTTLADITYWGEGTEDGYRRFRIYFWVSLPFVIVLLAAIAALFLGVIALLGASIAALVVLLVGEVAIGAAVSIVGVIYGVSQLFSSMPIGLFELGIAITVLGATMLLGIIIYNLAVRFLPFVLKQFFRFIRFFIAFLQDLYYYLKGECYRR